jgi:hypothetical protein
MEIYRNRKSLTSLTRLTGPAAAMPPRNRPIIGKWAVSAAKADQFCALRRISTLGPLNEILVCVITSDKCRYRK